MASQRIQDLQRKFERNTKHVLRWLDGIPADGWDRPVYEKPAVWTLRDLLAHFVSAEKELTVLARDIAAGGTGAPQGFDYDEFNRTEQEAYRSWSPERLRKQFIRSRETTLEWISALTDGQLDYRGIHPALGEATLETILTAIHGHILMHLRDL